MNRRWVVLVLLIVVVAGCRPLTAWPGIDKVMSAVDEQRAHETVAELASPACAGRRTGTTGEAHAAAWITSQFKAAGLEEPRGYKGHFGTYGVPLHVVNSFTGIKATGARGEAFVGDRGMAIPFAGSGNVEADAGSI
ncbi:MAG: hypothetical protein WAW16_07880 [Candidatus Cryosericum sp.]